MTNSDPGGLGAALSGALTALSVLVVALGHALGWDDTVVTAAAGLVVAVGNVGIILWVRTKAWAPQSVTDELAVKVAQAP